MAGHVWVALTYQPITVELADDGESLNTYTHPEAEEAAREDAALGCMLCKTPLTTKTFHEVCPG